MSRQTRGFPRERAALIRRVRLGRRDAGAAHVCVNSCGPTIYEWRSGKMFIISEPRASAQTPPRYSRLSARLAVLLRATYSDSHISRRVTALDLASYFIHARCISSLDCRPMKSAIPLRAAPVSARERANAARVSHRAGSDLMDDQ